MQLVDQHTKKIMEGCKERARSAGLKFQDETLEYIVTNRDLLELHPKIMIPTLYDYWVHDVEVLKEKGKYELYPNNPYETVINTRPAISFYNDNNPDWLNVMIFYHVLAHIDFFQNNLFFRHTWNYDFTGQALSDKRLIAKMRSEKGRWVDYIIEFTRNIDNLVGYYNELSLLDQPQKKQISRLDFYFDIFLQSIKKVKVTDYIQEIGRYNDCVKQHGESGEQYFFTDIKKQHPEFESLYKKNIEGKSISKLDLIQYIMENSKFLNKYENKWMKSVMEVVRKTSLFFQPQIRTKIMNEGWASYWHENLFSQDDRISSHEVDFARVNSGVTTMPRVGLNPYALGMRLFYYIEKMADKGKISAEFQRIANSDLRDKFDKDTCKGRDFIFNIRETLSDFMFISAFVDQDFVNENRLFVAGKRLNHSKMVWEYYVKSKKVKDYKNMLINSLYHPPHIEVDLKNSNNNTLYINHHFEEKPLVNEFITNTMVGIEYLWGGTVYLETSEVIPASHNDYLNAPSYSNSNSSDEMLAQKIKWRRVLYMMKNRNISKRPVF